MDVKKIWKMKLIFIALAILFAFISLYAEGEITAFGEEISAIDDEEEDETELFKPMEDDEDLSEELEEGDELDEEGYILYDKDLASGEVVIE